MGECWRLTTTIRVGEQGNRRAGGDVTTAPVPLLPLLLLNIMQLRRLLAATAPLADPLELTAPPPALLPLPVAAPPPKVRDKASAQRRLLRR